MNYTLTYTLVVNDGEMDLGDANEVVCWEATLGKIVPRAKQATRVSIFDIFLSFKEEAKGFKKQKGVE